MITLRCYINRIIVLSKYSCHKFSTEKKSKTSLIPLFRKIHPDLYGQEQPYVRQGNMDCMQKLTEIFEFIDSHQHFVADAVQSQFTTTLALQPTYDLKCYAYKDVNTTNVAKQTGNESSEPDENVVQKVLFQVGIKMKIPSILTSKQQVTRAEFIQAVRLVKRKLTEFYEHLDVESPWPKKGAMTDAEEQEAFGFVGSGSGVDGFLTQEIVDTDIFENAIKNSNSVGSWTFFLDDKKDRNAARYKQELKVMVERFADAYIQGGNVLVKGLNPSEELKAITKLRNFFAEYGTLVNFTAETWRNIFIVINAPTPESLFKLKNPQETRISTKVRQMYQYEKSDKGKHVFKIPNKFRPTELIAFIQKNVRETVVI